MTREDKIKKKQERKYKRIGKRIEKDKKYISFLVNDYSYRRGISYARKRLSGRLFGCEMGYSDCEMRGYCNGDC